MDNKEKETENRQDKNDSIFIKKTLCVGSIAVLGIAIIFTAFVFGRSDRKLTVSEKSSKKETTAAAQTTVTVDAEDKKEAQTSVTTTVSETKTTVQTTTAEEKTTSASTQKTPEETTTEKSTEKTGSVEATAAVSNTWDENGKKCSQIDVVIKNNSDAQKDGWTVTIVFDKNVEITNSWNGNFTVNGNKITAAPVDFNSKIEKGAEVTFGFIVSSEGDIKITSADV